MADALAWVGRREVLQNYWVRRGLAALGAVLLIAFMVATTVVEKQEDVFNAVDQGALHSQHEQASNEAAAAAAAAAAVAPSATPAT